MHHGPNLPAKADGAPPPAPAQPQNVVRGSRQLRYLSAAVILEEGGISKLVRATIFLICGAVLAFLAWASITHVDEVAIAFGEVVPSGQVRILQHLEGGTVSEIMVSEGQVVKEGDPLVRLAPQQTEGDLRQMQARAMGLQLRAERLRSFIEGRDPDFSFATAPEFKPMIDEQLSLLRHQRETVNANELIFISQIEQRHAEIRQLQEQLVSLRREADLAQELYEIRKKLYEENLVSRVVYLDTERAWVTAKSGLRKTQDQIGIATEALREAENRLEGQNAAAIENAAAELGTAMEELTQLNEAVSKIGDRVDRLVIRAPVDGLVQDMRATNVGSVIPPGGIVTHVVPADDTLQVEARIQARDIGHVQVGQPVTVKISAYEFARYGTIKGELVNVSASTFVDEEKNPYYKGIVRVVHSYVGDNDRNKILPGMTAQVDIKTGEKSLLEYLMRPIFLAFNQAFHER